MGVWLQKSALVAAVIVPILGLFALAWFVGALSGGECSKVDVADWNRVEVGMSMKEVQKIMGRCCESMSSNDTEWWGYQHSHGFAEDTFSPHPLSYAIYFTDGRVSLKLVPGVEKPMDPPR